VTRDGFRCVVFDCDSTLVKIEGIDELAGPRIDEVRRMTDLAMDGSLPLEEVYGRRLALIDPTRDQVDAVGEAYVRELVDDARETVAALLYLEKTVRIVSGGLRPPVERVAAELGLAAGAVAAVGISFDGRGRYLDFERDSPLARSGGKPDVLAGWSLLRPALLVGDGATDLEARVAVDCFAAFMGVVDRPAVARGADLVLTEPTLAPVLALAADEAERARLRGSPWADLLRRGEMILATAGAALPDA
jgi:phosphoserine phosphatase